MFVFKHGAGECILGLVFGGVNRSRLGCSFNLESQMGQLLEVLASFGGDEVKHCFRSPSLNEEGQCEARTTQPDASGIREAHAPFGLATALAVRRGQGLENLGSRWSVRSGGASASQDLVPWRHPLKPYDLSTRFEKPSA